MRVIECVWLLDYHLLSLGLAAEERLEELQLDSGE